MNCQFNDETCPMNQLLIRVFYLQGRLGGLPVQMEAVRRLISYFSNENNLEVDKLLIEQFPEGLSSEFNALCDGETNVIDHETLKRLFLDVFTFVFRNENMVMEPKARSFIELFLKFIKTSHTIQVSNLDALIDSIIICVSYVPNKILFINNNAIFNFYYCFRNQDYHLSQKFLTMVENVYTLEPLHSSSLCHIHLTERVNGMMNKFLNTKVQDWANMLLIVLRMVHHLRLLMEIDIDINKFYDTTVLSYLRCVSLSQYSMLMCDLSKIWSIILNSPRNTLKIDTIDKLTNFTAIFSIDVSSRLFKVRNGHGTFKVTKNTKQKIYIIYLTLVIFPLINQSVQTWTQHTLIQILTDLHDLFKSYLEQHSIDLIENLPVPDQFLLYQYYIKSSVTLNVQNDPVSQGIIQNYFERLSTNPSLSNVF
ncbi:hypothetical protein RF11_14598 [Thelohanellus kitauei]|uniref:Uncharacterized protein n=1 Tax=Thelohanellus kitauei TaxID=669202 RepID=A0A0C2JNB9_THEKT|nr:hypothetical protein RF11_14598 [Thelohanellus kitauei]